MTESAYPDPTSSSPGAFVGNGVTAIEPSYPVVDPSIFPPSNGTFLGPDDNVDPSTTHRSTPRHQVEPRHALSHHMGAHHQYTLQETISSSSFLPTQSSTSVDESGANGQIVRTSPLSWKRELSHSEDGTQADSMQGQPPKKRQRKSCARGNTSVNGAAIGKSREISGVGKCDETFGIFRRDSDHRGPTFRWIDGALEWFDKEEFQWSKSTHHDVILGIEY